MEQAELIIGVHSSGESDSDAKALIEAFRKNGAKAFTTQECDAQNLVPNLTIGYDSTGISGWQKYLNKNITNIMWSGGSVFEKNTDFVEQFAKMPNFILLTSTPCDTEPVGRFFASLKHGALIHGAKPAENQKNFSQREYDFLFSSDIVDIDEKMAELKAKMPEFVYKMMMDMFHISSNNPVLSFWQIYKLFCENFGLAVDFEQYLLLFSNVAPLITSNKKIQMIKALKDFNVKVSGCEIWKKYIDGKVEYIGAADSSQFSNAKIVLHYQSVEMSMGLEKSMLEAAAAGAFILSSKTPSIESIFGSNMEYFDSAEFKDIAQKADYLLKNLPECEKRAEKVLQSLRNENSLEKRVGEILGLVR